MVDDVVISLDNGYPKQLKGRLKEFKKHPLYPEQKNEHNAIADARWNKDLFDFLTKHFPVSVIEKSYNDASIFLEKIYETTTDLIVKEMINSFKSGNNPHL